MDVPIAQQVPNIACIPFVAFVFILLVAIIVFSFLSLVNNISLLLKLILAERLATKHGRLPRLTRGLS